MSPLPFKTRFAPSPSGLLHLGKVRTALFNAILAKKHQGIFLLRIEDTDQERSRADYAQAIMQDLHWLGLDWQEGPPRGGQTDDKEASYLQSQRLPIYRRYFADLEVRGLVYPCFCSAQELALSRKTQLAVGRPPRYSGRCYRLSKAEVEARLAENEPASLRFHVPPGAHVKFDDKVRGPQDFLSDDIGDFIIRRSDGTPAFFFSNAIDDALMDVTLVLRGEDHLTNTPRQILLLNALNLPAPEYAHIALVVGDDGAPLSKRHGSRSVQELRETGFFPRALNNYLARLGHSYADNAYLDMDRLTADFDLARLGRAPARYDGAQLLHWQHEAVLHASEAELWRWMGARVHRLVPVQDRSSFLEAVRANIAFPTDAGEWADRIYSDNLLYSEEARNAITNAKPDFFEKAATALDSAMDFSAFANSLKGVTGTQGKALFQPLRSALTGQTHGPEMVRIFPLIGMVRAKYRLNFARQLKQTK
jgi:glutamyl-tRNA synthetase